jgi:hypothetical protein
LPNFLHLESAWFSDIDVRCEAPAIVEGEEEAEERAREKKKTLKGMDEARKPVLEFFFFAAVVGTCVFKELFPCLYRWSALWNGFQ